MGFSLINANPNAYGGQCGKCELPQVQHNFRPGAPMCDRVPVQQCDGSFTTVHCLLDRFLKLYSQYECRGPDFIDCMLTDAEACTAGFVNCAQRERATMLLAAHMIEVQAVQATESASRVAAAAKGSGALARPSGPGSAPHGEAYYALSAYGIAYWEMVETNPTVGLLAIG